MELNAARERLGLPPLPFTHGGISRDLAIVATFPQLEYPRPDGWPGMRVTGPLLWEQPFGDVELPPLVQGPPRRMAPGRVLAAGVPIDLNRASPEELEALPGVGPQTAARLCQARPLRDAAAVVAVLGPRRAAALAGLVVAPQ